MKRTVGFLICLVVFVTTAGVVLAQTDQPATDTAADTTTPVRKQNAPIVAPGTRGNEVSQQRQEMVAQQQGERAQVMFQHILRRFSAAAGRIEHISSRISSRIAVVSIEHDTSEAEAYVEEAQQHVANAQALLEQAETQFEAVLASNNPRAMFTAVKDLFLEAKDELIAAHEALRSAIESLRLLVQQEAVVPADPFTPEKGQGETEADTDL